MTGIRRGPSGRFLSGIEVAGELRYLTIVDDQQGGIIQSWTPAGFTEDTTTVRFNPTANTLLRGMFLYPGQELTVRIGRTSTFSVTFSPEDSQALSTGQRFTTPQNRPLVLRAGESVQLRESDNRIAVIDTSQSAIKLLSRNTGIVSATNATTELSAGGVVSFLAGALQATNLYYFQAYWEFAHTAAATPVLQVGFSVNGATPTYLSMTPASNAATYQGSVEALLRVSAVGAGGGYRANTQWKNPSGLAIADQVGGGNQLVSVDTTADSTLEMRMRMATAVPSNSLSIYNAMVQQIG